MRNDTLSEFGVYFQPRGTRLPVRSPQCLELPETGLKVQCYHTSGISVPTMGLTAQRYRIRRRISQLRFLDSALLHPICEVGRRRIVALRDELLGGPVGEQRLDFRTVLVQLAFSGAFRSSDRPDGRPSRAKDFLRPRGDQPPLDLSCQMVWNTLKNPIRRSPKAVID